MPVTITSTTDTPEAINLATGKAVEKVESKKVEEKSATETKESVETKAATEPAIDKETSTEANGENAEEKSASDAEAKAKKKGGFKKRIDKLNAKISEVEAQALHWRNEALKVSQPAAKTETKVETKSDGRPEADKFANHSEYVEALADWRVEQKLSEREQKSNEVAAKAESQKKVVQHVERVNKFKADHADFDDVVSEVGDIPISMTFQQVVLDSDNGPELIYNLAKDPAEYKRIQSLPAIAAAREIGKLEARLAKSAASNEPLETKTTKAPAPISPVNKGKVTATKNPDEMTYPEFKKWREETARR